MADVKWIKIVTDIFDNRKIRQIERLPESDAIINIWFKLLCLAGNLNENGFIVLTKDIAYTDEMLACEFRKSVEIIRLALSVFVKFGMIEIVNSIYCISNWEKYQNIDGLDKIREKNRLRVAKYRENQKRLLTGDNISNVTCNVTVTDSNAVELDKDKDDRQIDKNNIYIQLEKIELIQNQTEKYEKIFIAKDIYINTDLVVPYELYNQIKLYQKVISELVDSNQVVNLENINFKLLEKIYGQVIKVDNIENVVQYFKSALINEIIRRND